MRFFEKDALWGGGVTHRSWPGGQGGKPRALVAGEGWGGRKGWMAVSKKGVGWVQTLKRRPLGPPLGPRLGLGGGGPRASVPGVRW